MKLIVVVGLNGFGLFEVFQYQKKIFLSVFGEAQNLSYICIAITAEVVELADTLALGASAYALRVRVPSSVQLKRTLSRPFFCTNRTTIL